MKKIVLLLAAGSFLFTACKKDDNTPSRESQVQGKWMITSARASYTLAGQAFPEEDILTNTQPCERDNLLDFRANYDFYQDEGATKCNTSDPQTQQQGTWKLTNSDQKLEFTQSGMPVAMTIDELSGSTMRLSQDTTISFNGISAQVKTKLSLTKQ